MLSVILGFVHVVDICVQRICLPADVVGTRHHKGLSMRSDHYKKRTECLNKFATFYGGYLPLHYTSVRIHRA